MLTCICWVCETERQISGLEQPSPICSPECADDFADIVGRLTEAAAALPRMTGIGSEGVYYLRRLHPIFADLGIDQSSRLAMAAVDEMLRLRRSWGTERREWRAWDYERNRPKRLRPLYPI